MRPFAVEGHVDALNRFLCGDCLGRSTFALARREIWRGLARL